MTASIKWLQRVQDALLVRSLAVLHGNINDLVLCPPEYARDVEVTYGMAAAPSGGTTGSSEAETGIMFLDVDSLVGLELQRGGCDIVLLYSQSVGVWVLRESMAEPAREALGIPPVPATGAATNAGAFRRGFAQGIIPLQQILARLVAMGDGAATRHRVGLVLRGVARADLPGTTDQVAFLQSMAARHSTGGARALHAGVTTVMLYEREGSIPYDLGQATGLSRVCTVPLPGTEERERALLSARNLFYEEVGKPATDVDRQNVAARLDGFSLRDILGLAALSRQESIGLEGESFPRLYERYTASIRENEWEKVPLDAIRNSEQELGKRVVGQDEAIKHVVARLVQARAGTASMMGSRRRPRGVFFFAGPTGVGKTELSKAIANLIFKDESTLVTFDMSEYSAEHEVARLIGSPPGYRGHEEGGQLVRRMVDRPFSVVLFDEIEKAHGRLLDKFLQILEEGRLTDGQGRVASFSEALIIFTSNLGAATPAEKECPNCAESIKYKARRCRFCGIWVDVEPAANAQALDTDQATAPTSMDGVVRPRLGGTLAPRGARQQRSIDAVRDFFVTRLGRPELLNRIGQHNVIAFNDLREPEDRTVLVDRLVQQCRRECAADQNVDVTFDEGFLTFLRWHPDGIDNNGGRGVRNLIQQHVLAEVSKEMLMSTAGQTRNRATVTANIAEDEVEEYLLTGRVHEIKPVLHWR